MKVYTAPILDSRDANAVFAELVARCPSFLPEWRAAAGDPGVALLRIVARYAQLVVDRLNRAPDRALLAFLDMLGVGLIPGQPARAPIVFTTIAGGSDSRAEAGARVGAKVPGLSAPVVFETEQAIALAGARLTDVVSLWPDRDAYARHSSPAASGRPFTPFQSLQPVPHLLYLAHDAVFRVTGKATIQIAVDLDTPGSAAIPIVWELWDGRVWQPFKPFDAADAELSQDGTAGFRQSGTVTLRVGCGSPEPTTIHGIKALWIRGRADAPLPPDPTRVFPSLDRVRVRATVDQAGGELPLDVGFSGSTKVDVSRTFHPFGLQPTPGGAFYFSNKEAFGKPGAKVSVTCSMAGTSGSGLAPKVAIEYWNGRGWRAVPGASGGDFTGGNDLLSFTVPVDMAETDVNATTGFWIRAHLVSGGYGTTQDITIPVDQKIPVIRTNPPAIASVKVGYTWSAPWQPVDQCLTDNDFQFEVHTLDVRWPGNFFQPFRPVMDAVPALYFGFDGPLPNDAISLYVDVQETAVPGPPLIWEVWDGQLWRSVGAVDDSAALTRPGMVSFIAPQLDPRPQATVRAASERRIQVASALDAARFAPGELVTISQADAKESVRVQEIDDRTLVLESPLAGTYPAGTVARAALARFGTPRDWLRARLKENGAPGASVFNGIYLNAAWALQSQTITGEVLGSGNGQPWQTLFFTQFPVLPGEEIEVRELDGPRAAVEMPILRDELLALGYNDDDIRVVSEPRSRKVREVWVRWRSRPHFYFSGPTDRHYVVEPAKGRLLFGDGRTGRLAAVGADNVKARVYRAGGTAAGNVARGTINQMLGGAFAASVTNPRAATGGADTESPDQVMARGPETLRHRWRALTAGDYEAMAREASPSVAAVRVLPATAPNGRPAPGWVTVIVVPQSSEPQPQPSLELRRQVHDYLAARAPSTLAAPRIAVIGPTYRPVGVAALVAPVSPDQAGLVGVAIRYTLERFLHPLTGGPEGRGWEFGRDVFLSDVAAILESVRGVDYVAQLDLLLDDAAAGARVPVPDDQIVVAGAIRIEMEAPEA